MVERTRDQKGFFLPIHGMRHTRLYKVWEAMKRRCNNPKDSRFERYGGRGIKVCAEWENSFERFAEWAFANGYREQLTIDRIDNNKGYSPDNCRWATHKEQNRNYSRNHRLTFNGKTQCVADWAKETGLNGSTILYRLKQGKTVEEALYQGDRRSLRWKKTTSLNCMR